ncbi:hypothetical protein [Microbacterium resistens]|uniref:hypothetical protein n=1 Tax=Microbacterium resistens TaxID=156977 RepID=UPI0012F88008|nr:hypothetical protein [Microbacterium resistens]
MVRALHATQFMAGTLATVLCIGLSGCSWASRGSGRDEAEKDVAFSVSDVAARLKSEVPASKVGKALTSEDLATVGVLHLLDAHEQAADSALHTGEVVVFESSGDGTRSRVQFWTYQEATIDSVFSTTARAYGCGSLTLAADRSVTLADSECPGWVTARFPSSTIRVVSLEEVLTKQKGRTTW